MSSYLRTIQKRILKKMGYVRQSHEVRNDQVVRLKKGEGKIIGPNGELVGQHYPQVVATRS